MNKHGFRDAAETPPSSQTVVYRDRSGMLSTTPPTDTTEETLLGPRPLAIEFQITLAGAQAICDESGEYTDDKSLDLRVVFGWDGPEVFIRRMNSLGEFSWVDISPNSYWVGLMRIDKNSVISLAVRRLALMWSNRDDGGGWRATANGGRIIDLGTI